VRGPLREGPRTHPTYMCRVSDLLCGRCDPASGRGVSKSRAGTTTMGTVVVYLDQLPPCTGLRPYGDIPRGALAKSGEKLPMLARPPGIARDIVNALTMDAGDQKICNLTPGGKGRLQGRAIARANAPPAVKLRPRLSPAGPCPRPNSWSNLDLLTRQYEPRARQDQGSLKITRVCADLKRSNAHAPPEFYWHKQMNNLSEKAACLNVRNACYVML
jgi:hypothetical protein